MIIKVTQAHIERGIKKDCSMCPIALAIAKASGSLMVSANPLYLRYTLPGQAYYAQTPVECSRFMVAFDTGESAEPFTFEVGFIRL